MSRVDYIDHSLSSFDQYISAGGTVRMPVDRRTSIPLCRTQTLA